MELYLAISTSVDGFQNVVKQCICVLESWVKVSLESNWAKPGSCVLYDDQSF